MTKGDTHSNFGRQREIRKMGCGASSAESPQKTTQQKIDELKIEYRITDHSWELLNSSFEKLSKNGTSVEMESYVDHFSKFGAGTKLATKIGKALDTDNSGEISKYEYLRFFCIHLGGSDHQKIASFFTILDSDSNN
jgi:hypothetical protein